ncbi:MAG: outer membrane beta-barrel protein [Bacteroidia bacterium]
MKNPLAVLPAVIFLLFNLQVNAQVSGKITNAEKAPLPFVQVALVKASDSAIVAMAVTDESGKFEIKTKDSGNFRVLAAYLGYKRFYSPAFSLSAKTPQYNAGNIVLEAEAKDLKSVEVAAQKPFVEYKPDRTVYNIENSIISAGNNVLEVLKKLPGVAVDNNDNISVNSQSGVLIMIDGRTSYLSAADAATYLRSLDAGQVEKIEIITNPSAKYDAAGSSVINIVMKRNKNLGLNAELTSGYEQGIYGGGREGININYTARKWDISANYGYSFNTYGEYIGMINKFTSNDIIQNTFNDTLLKKGTTWTNSGRVAADFMPGKKQTIGFVFDGMQNTGVMSKNYTNNMYGASSHPDSIQALVGQRNTGTVNTTYDLNYTLKMDSAGEELSAAIDYATFSSTFNETDVTNYYDSLGRVTQSPTTLRFSHPTTVNIWAARIDYTLPLGKNGKLETGLKSSYVTTDNNAWYWNVVNGENVVDTAFTNQFTYKEYIYAGYVSYSQQLGKKFDYQLGLRGEETEAKGIQTVHDTAFTHDYFNLFPTVLANYKLDSINTLKLYYRRKIWRPDYQSLNPFIYVMNNYSYGEGNPALLPAISNAVYIEEVYRQFLGISVGDEYWTNTISNITTQNNTTHVIYSIPENFKNFNNTYAKAEASIPIAKWFTSMNSALFMQQQYQGNIEGAGFSMAQFVWTFNSVNMFTLGKDWSCEAEFDYSSRAIDGEFIDLPVYTVEAGIKKSFAHQRGTVTLNCGDVLWSSHNNSYAIFQNTNFQYYQITDSRRLNLSLSWKLGKSEHEQQEKQKAAEEEINRVR